MYRVSFRLGDDRRFVHRIDATGFVHVGGDQEASGLIPEEFVHHVVRMVLTSYGPVKIVIDPIGV